MIVISLLCFGLHLDMSLDTKVQNASPSSGRMGTAHDHPSTDPNSALEDRCPALAPAEEGALEPVVVGATSKHDTNRHCTVNMQNLCSVFAAYLQT
jgi:hypothetical protein